MTTYLQGARATLTAQFYEYAGGPPADVDATTITITPAAGGAAVIGPTATGVVEVSTGLFTYNWDIGSGQAAGDYVVLWSGTDDNLEVVTATEVVAVAANSTAYATLANLKLKVGGITDSTRDSLLSGALLSASRGIDTKCDRRFYADTSASARTYQVSERVSDEPDGTQVLAIDDVSTTTGLVVEIGDGSTWTTVTDYDLVPDNALVRGLPITGLRRTTDSWSGTRARVTAAWGWPDVPDQVEEATLIQAARLYKRKDSPEGVTGSADWGAIRVSRIDPDVAALIQPFVRLG